MAKSMKVAAAPNKSTVKTVGKTAIAKAKKSKAPDVAKKVLTTKKLSKHAKASGSMSLDDKLEMLKTKTPQEVTEAAKTLFTKVERSKLWNRHATGCRNNPEEAQASKDADTKHKKTMLSLAWNLDKSRGSLYEGLVQSVTVSEAIKRPERANHCCYT